MTDEKAPPLPGGPIPEPVIRLAAERALGEYVAERGWGNPWAKVGQSLLLALIAVAGEVVIRVLGILFIFNIALIILFIGGISNAIAALARGRQDNYLFTGGLVHVRRDSLRAIPWAQVARLGRSTGNRGLTGGRRFPLQLLDGSSVTIPLVQVDGRDTFIERLVDLLKRHGRPVD
jgi:hypothetical protein